MARTNFLIIAAATALLAGNAGAVDNGLAITPQMGCKYTPLPSMSYVK